MGRKAFFTEEQVFAAADTLAATGKEVSASALLNALGGGSLTTIYKHLDVWKQTRPALVAPVVAMDLPEPVQIAFVAAWKVAASEAAREVSAVRDKAAEDVKVAARQFEEALEQIRRLEAESESDAVEIEELKAKLAEAEALVRAAQSESVGQAAAVEQLKAQLVRLERDLERESKEAKEAAELRGRIASLQEQNNKLIESLTRQDKQK